MNTMLRRTNENSLAFSHSEGTGFSREYRLWRYHNLMATTLPPVNAREVIRCDECLLVQFLPHQGLSGLCRRCRTPLDEPVMMEAAPPPPLPPAPTGPTLAQTIRSLRLRLGLSQRQLAILMTVPRTYVSKIENEKATPTLSSLERLARALECTIPELVSGD